MRKIIAGILMTLAVVPLSASGQDESGFKGSTSLTQTTDGSTGPISRAVTLTAGRQAQLGARFGWQPQQTGQTKSWPARHPVLAGVVIGAGALAFLVSIDCGEVCIPGGASLGAGIGAGIGFAISRLRK